MDLLAFRRGIKFWKWLIKMNVSFLMSLFLPLSCFTSPDTTSDASSSLCTQSTKHKFVFMLPNTEASPVLEQQRQHALPTGSVIFPELLLLSEHYCESTKFLFKYAVFSAIPPADFQPHWPVHDLENPNFYKSCALVQLGLLNGLTVARLPSRVRWKWETCTCARFHISWDCTLTLPASKPGSQRNRTSRATRTCRTFLCIWALYMCNMWRISNRQNLHAAPVNLIKYYRGGTCGSELEWFLGLGVVLAPSF